LRNRQSWWTAVTATWISALGLVLSAALIAVTVLALVAAWQLRRPVRAGRIFAEDRPGTAFLFLGDRLLDATADALALLPDGDRSRAWPSLLGKLAPIFPDLASGIASLPEGGTVAIASAPDVRPPIVLRGEHMQGVTRLTLEPARRPATGEAGDLATHAALLHELQTQRALLARAPVLMWKDGPDGAVIWANHAYLIRATELLPDGEDLSWPLPRLFAAADPADRWPTRVKLSVRSGAEWFELSRVPVGKEVLNYAIAANATVEAETALREFMQTLTKTFADLPIGLAIFDRSRVLQLFNPALAELTALQPEFLISRPTLSAVLDAMRAKAMIPEPKDYRTWRKQLMRVEEEASSGHFEETWSLPGGQTYRVVGRPHPNGALAFMFEDISTEMTRTRRYRADLELGQSVIDAVDDAVAVFSQAGQLVMSNRAYAQIWNHDPAVLLSDAGIARLSSWWRENSAPSLLWDDAISYVTAFGDRSPWEGEIRLLDGRMVTCRFRPLAGGATLITFALDAVTAQPLRLEDPLRGRLSA
jgi:PAS domain-containing protein